MKEQPPLVFMWALIFAVFWGACFLLYLAIPRIVVVFRVLHN